MHKALPMLVFCIASALYAVVPLSFSDLKKFDNSPHYQMLLQKQKSLNAAIHDELKWSNPELEGEIERLSSESVSEVERIAALSKHMMTPWSYATHRKMLHNELQAVEYLGRKEKTDLLAELRLLYTQLAIQTQLHHRLQKLHSALNRTQDRIKEQHRQGSISGLEEKLVSVSLFNTHAHMLHVEQQRMALEQELVTRLGLPQSTELFLTTAIDYHLVDLPSRSELFSKARLSSAFLFNAEKVAVAEKRVAFEKGNILPEIGVSAGYKTVNDEMQGTVIGLTLPLPVFNSNRFKVQQSQAELVQTQLSRDLYSAHYENEIRVLYASFEKTVDVFQRYADLFSTDQDMVDDLVYSYEQGWLSVSELLNSLQVYADGLDSYYEHLAHYYETIFQLEKLTEHIFIQFED